MRGLRTAQGVVVDAEPCRSSPSEKLSTTTSDVLASSSNCCRSLAALQIEADTALASIPDPVPRLLGKRIARGRLDPYDVGTVVGQEHRGHGAGDAPGQVEDAQIFECSSHTTPPLHIPVGSTIVLTMSLHHETAQTPRPGRVRRPSGAVGVRAVPLELDLFDLAGIWAQPAIEGSDGLGARTRDGVQGPEVRQSAHSSTERTRSYFRRRRTPEAVMSLILS